MAEEFDSQPKSEQVIWLIRNFERYLDIEKEQIKDANIEGTEHGYRERAVFGLDARPYSKKRAEEYYNENYNKIKEVIDGLKPIEVADGLKTFKRIIEDRPTEFSQYNAHTLLFVIDLIQNGQEVPEQMELIKLIRKNK